jgi:hypothetical protein
MDHNLTVENDGRIHYARCSCGWAGVARQMHKNAQSDADWHEAGAYVLADLVSQRRK